MATTTSRRSRSTTSGGSSPSSKAPKDGSEPSLSGRLFDGTGRDRDVEVTRKVVRGLDEAQTLWLDLQDPGQAEVDVVGQLFDLEPRSIEALRREPERPELHAYERYLELDVRSVETADEEERTVGLTVVIGPNWVVTVHPEPVAFLDSFREQLKGDTPIGLVDGPSLAAAMLDWHLTGYFRVVEALQLVADRVDERALDPRNERQLLGDLVRLRRRVAGVRRELAPHREAYAALARPDLTKVGENDDAKFRALAERLERAIEAVGVARELVLGSFDVHMTRTAQRTNDIMKVLTLASVILLPGSVIAGVMGMNFKVGLFDDPNLFWVVLAGMAAIAVTTLVAARLRRWI